MHYFDFPTYGLIVPTQYGVPISHESRRVTQEDFYKFTHILASDNLNLNDLLRKKPDDSTVEVKLWGSYLDGEPIADPYYGGVVSWHCVRHGVP
jgi:low molecular weight phosphotyrosine protein phosphatase